jgi:hypothetical protein
MRQNQYMIKPLCGPNEVRVVDETNIREIRGQYTNMLTCTWRRKGAPTIPEPAKYKIERFLWKGDPDGEGEMYVEYYQLGYANDLQQMLLDHFCESFSP